MQKFDDLPLSDQLALEVAALEVLAHSGESTFEALVRKRNTKPAVIWKLICLHAKRPQCEPWAGFPIFSADWKFRA